MNGLVAATIAANVVVLALGGAVARVVYRAYRRTRSVTLGLAAAGFGCLVLGLLLGGGAVQVFGLDALVAAFLESVLVAFGFGLLAYSFYAEVPAEVSATA